jgi:hypothetical protein
MRNCIDPAVHSYSLAHITLREYEMGMIEHMGDVIQAAGRQVVQADDLISSRDQGVTQM